MTDFYSQNRCVCSTRSHGPLLCAFCLSFHFKRDAHSPLEGAGDTGRSQELKPDMGESTTKTLIWKMVTLLRHFLITIHFQLAIINITVR